MYKIEIPSNLLEKHRKAYVSEVRRKILDKCKHESARSKLADYWALYGKYIQDDDMNLLIAKPDILCKFIEEESNYRHEHKLQGKTWKRTQRELAEIYPYSSFARYRKHNDDGWDAARFLRGLNIHACCYCNAEIV